MVKVSREELVRTDAEINNWRMVVRRRLFYGSTIVLMIIYASAIILLVLSMSGCAVSSGYGAGALEATLSRLMIDSRDRSPLSSCQRLCGKTQVGPRRRSIARARLARSPPQDLRHSIRRP